MTSPLEAHLLNKATLNSVESVLKAAPPITSSSSQASSTGTATPPVNPLLNRGKPKAAKKPNKKLKKKVGGAPAPELVSAVQQAKAGELDVVGAGGIDDDGKEEEEVLDLADQLLEQLDARLGEEEPAAAKAEASPPAGGTREKLGEMIEGAKEALGVNENGETSSNGEPRVSRQKARKLRKANHFDQVRKTAQEEMAAENDRSVQDERDAIAKGCTKLGVRIKEIDPDGHCLFSAIADQVNFLKLSERKETYPSTRAHAALYMRTHPDDFLPFLESENDADGIMSPAEYERYCVTVEKTAEWGGEVEIKALSKYFEVPIHVLQAGTDVVQIGDEFAGRGPLLISYHRKMYGLGEHYNSLRPATYEPSATVPVLE